MDIRNRHIIIAIALIGFIAVLIRPEIISDLIIFVFLGVVPGMTYVIPSWISLVSFAFALIFAVRWLIDQPTYEPVATTKERSQRARARRRVLKKTTPTASRLGSRVRKQVAKAKA